MSDSFADLWNSTAPSKPTPPPRKLGAAPATAVQPKRSQYDSFSLLSSAGSSAPNSRPITPSAPKPVPKPAPKPVANGDAFSDLLGSASLGESNGARMTIAQRAAMVERQRAEQIHKRQQQQQQHSLATHSSPWAGLDTLAAPSTSSSKSTAAIDDWPFDAPTIVAPNPTQSTKAPPAVADHDDDWGLADFAPPAPSPAPSRTRSQALWDLDEFSSRHSPSPPPTKRSDSPGDFDFGDHEDGLLDNDSHDDDDILGVLSKPVDAIPKRPSRSTEPTTTRRDHDTPSPRPNASTASSRAISPPPHILGQIVEMGFSVQQARVALASTDTGLDVQAALEALLSNGAASPSPASQQAPPTTAPPRRRPAVERVRERDTPSPSGSQTQSELKIQEQADKLIAQASEIGLSVFNKASTFWNVGKEKVQKAYEERAAAAAGGASSSSTGGRPKWMQETVGHDSDDEAWTDKHKNAFKDDLSPPQSAQPARREKQRPPPPPQETKPRIGNLFSDDSAPTAYVSPFRRARPKPAESASTSAAPPAFVKRSPSPIRQVPRSNLVSASSSVLARSEQSKSVGGEKFRLGQYADAESAYSAAIACIPSGHLALVPLHNNRALVRLKIGDYQGAIDDASLVIDLIGAGYHPAREMKVERREDGGGVDLGDGLMKALKRRAEAWEGREKWTEAGKDWEMLAGLDWAKASFKTDAVRGAGRCRRMVDAANNPTKEKPKPKVPAARPPPRRAASSGQSKALSNLRTATEAAEAEDQAKYDLKDIVDARLLAWKGGKETNIRALIASLDTVLWPELGLQKVGLGELVTPSQVKIRYTKAIAKVHPDKLNANNSTLEQRMLANGVFGALNEAWNAFKQ